MTHCYEIIPSWKAYHCFNPWLGSGTFQLWGSAPFYLPQGGTSQCWALTVGTFILPVPAPLAPGYVVPEVASDPESGVDSAKILRYPFWAGSRIGVKNLCKNGPGTGVTCLFRQ